MTVPRWLQPTLARRLLGALMLAFALVAVALLAKDYLLYKAAMADNPGVRQLGRMLSTGLSEIEDPQVAARVLDKVAQEINGLRREDAILPGDLLFQLYDVEGRRIFATASSDAVAKAGLGEQTLDSVRYWTYRDDGPRWSLRLGEPTVQDLTLLGWLARELGAAMLLAFPLVLLPLWLAVHSGLAPLRRMARRMASIDSDPALSPVGVDLRYAELRPLGRAFDALLERLRLRMARERAFVHDAAHELRTPLAVIAAQAHVLGHAEGRSEREAAAAALLQSIKRTAHLSQQLLDLAALDRPPTQPPEPVDLVAWAGQLLIEQAPTARAREIELVFDAPLELQRRIDLPALHSVLQNLLDNALRYVPRGGRVEVSLQARGRVVMLAVADNGPGIAPAERGLVFERFWRGKDHNQPGSGLGLAIVRQAAGRLGGELRLVDGLVGALGGCGARFELSLSAPTAFGES